MNGMLTWHTDGHAVSMHVNGPDLEVFPLPCPNRRDDDAACLVGGVCLFEYSVNLYGLECNTGQVAPAEMVEFAWAWDGPDHDFEAGQLWIIPVDDPTFASWATQFKA